MHQRNLPNFDVIMIISGHSYRDNPLSIVKAYWQVSSDEHGYGSARFINT